MEAKSVTLVYFSPTGTTLKVLEGIAENIGAEEIRKIDLTKPDAESMSVQDIKDGLVILGAPVYGGRIPLEAEQRFAKVKGDGVPAVVVVVYGNREYDDALIELRDLAVKQGFKPVAAGAFIGEHSFSDVETPLAAGRPDTQDLAVAKDMGEKIASKLAGMVKAEDMGNIDVPGNTPLKERHAMNKIAPETDTSLCMMCMVCVGSCPTGAIVATDKIETDAQSCIQCCACIKACPAGARSIDSPQIDKAKAWLSETCRDRKEPVVFLD